MSQRCLLLAVRDRLRQSPTDGGLGLPAAFCEVMFDGQPPPSMAGEYWVSVHEGPCSVEDVEGLSEIIGVNVTVTVRTGKVPQDRMGINALVGPTGQSLDELLEKIKAALHKDPGPRSATDDSEYPVLALANAYIDRFLGASNAFVEPLVLQDLGRSEPKGPDWFSCDYDGSDGRLPPVGLARTLTFGGAKRVQVIEEQT